jgi:hypothetical protein
MKRKGFRWLISCMIITFNVTEVYSQATNKLDSIGYVGIGTPTPATLLDVAQSDNSDLVLITAKNIAVNASNQSASIVLGSGQTGIGYLRVNSAGGSNAKGGAVDMMLINSYTASANVGKLLFGTRNTIQAALDWNGRFGIGNSTPRTKLDVTTSDASTDADVVMLENNGSDSHHQSANIVFGAGNGKGYLRVNSSNATQTIGGASDITLMNTYTTSGKGYLHLGTQNLIRATIDAYGQLGIGTTTPGNPLDVNFDLPNTDATLVSVSNSLQNTGSQSAIIALNGGVGSGYLRVNSTGGGQTKGGAADMLLVNKYTDLPQYGKLMFGTQNTVRVVIDSYGYLGVGTTTPDERLTVAGNISANGIIKGKKVMVTQLGWSDYVFNNGYNLASLSMVEKFIKKHKHLPDVPSEREVRANGVNLGDTQALLLKKIEELTLHLIAQEKRINELEKKLRR